MNANKIKFEYDNVLPFIENQNLQVIQSEVETAHNQLIQKTGPGNEFLGWLDLPYTQTNLIEQINQLAQEVRKNSDAFVSIGIGGSYLGARAVIEAIQPEQSLEIYFAGQHIDANQIAMLLKSLEGKHFWVNVISKSGTTLEPAIAFRIIKHHMEKWWGKEAACKRIIATTDHQKGVLKKIADEEGYPSFIIPENVGGRFSVLTPVGLIPVAIAGINIEELLTGARDMAEQITNPDIFKNISYMYAALRTLLYRKGKTVEILANFNPALHYICEWWKQLFGESEGKAHQGIFPASVNYTTDLHSMGQYVQDGLRNLMETFLFVRNSRQKIHVPEETVDFDGLNYLAHKDLDEINYSAYQGTALAHTDGEVPNMTIELPEINAYLLGQLIFFFEKAVAISGYMLGVNPFIQPGVEDYKRNMFRLLGKP